MGSYKVKAWFASSQKALLAMTVLVVIYAITPM
jgi:hypothetical protein